MQRSCLSYNTVSLLCKWQLASELLFKHEILDVNKCWSHANCCLGDLTSPVASDVMKTEPTVVEQQAEYPTEYPIQMTEERREQERRVSVCVTIPNIIAS